MMEVMVLLGRPLSLVDQVENALAGRGWLRC
jgi:hypothetical protein